MILPKNIGVVVDIIQNKTPAGHVSIEYPQLSEIVPDEEYDEDAQLYTAVNLEALQRKYKTEQIPIFALGDSGTVFAVVVPHFINPITDSKVAKEIVKLGTNITSWIALAPSPLNNGVSVCKLDIALEIDGIFKDVPKIRPPHFVTGIVAAVTSQLAQSRQLNNASVLVLNAEGHMGFEKVDADLIMEAAELIGRILVGSNKASFIKLLSGRVRKINSGLTLGMYL